MCVELYPSGGIYMVFAVGEREVKGKQPPKEAEKAVGVDLGLAGLAALSLWVDASSGTLGRLNAPWIGSGCCREASLKKRFLSGNWFKAKRRPAKDHEHVKDFK